MYTIIDNEGEATGLIFKTYEEAEKCLQNCIEGCFIQKIK